MRYRIVAGCLAASINASAAQTNGDDWQSAVLTSLELLTGCYERQAKHALESQADENGFVTVVKVLCKHERQLFIKGLTQMLEREGKSKEEIISELVPLLAEQDLHIRNVYKNRKNKP